MVLLVNVVCTAEEVLNSRKKKERTNTSEMMMMRVVDGGGGKRVRGRGKEDNIVEHGKDCCVAKKGRDRLVENV